MDIKCIGCIELLREELKVKGRPLVVYNCPRFFPYACALGGLLRPASGIFEAVKKCQEDPLGHCVLCLKPDEIHYGEDIVSTCKEHYDAWSKWLDEHPEWRAHLAPKGRSVKANWVEAFREFVEDVRRQK